MTSPSRNARNCFTAASVLQQRIMPRLANCHLMSGSMLAWNASLTVQCSASRRLFPADCTRSVPGAEREGEVRQLLEVVGLQKLQRRLARSATTAQNRLESEVDIDRSQDKTQSLACVCC